MVGSDSILEIHVVRICAASIKVANRVSFVTWLMTGNLLGGLDKYAPQDYNHPCSAEPLSISLSV